MPKTLFMESTEVPAERTAAEISAVLISGGATQIASDYHEGRITGLRWTMKVFGRDVLFAMPVRVEPIYQIFYKRRVGYLSRDDEARMRAKAQRVAWRQLLRWTQAQMALIEVGMAEASEVFLPYLQTGSGQSLFEMMKGGEFKLLGPSPADKPQ